MKPTSLRELAWLFFRLGATAFGGPAAHIAMMQDEVVVRRKWLTEGEFLDLLGATNLIPGPNSTEMAIHIGWQRRRWAGLLVAGVCFIVPAMLMTGALGWVTVRNRERPQLEWLLYGVKPVMLAVVLQALVALAPKAAKSWWLRGLALACAGFVVAQVNELLVLLGAGVLTVLVRRPPRASMPAMAVPLPSLFWVFFKTGSVLFGSGYVLLAFLRADLVERLHWLTDSQLIDAIAVGQVTPGPVFTTATYIGYVLAGPSGALVATLGIFLPAFIFVAASGPLVPRLRASKAASAFLDGVNVASLALMAVVTVELGATALVDGVSVALALVSAALLLKFRLNSTWLVLGGGLVGLVTHTSM